MKHLITILILFIVFNIQAQDFIFGGNIVSQKECATDLKDAEKIYGNYTFHFNITSNQIEFSAADSLYYEKILTTSYNGSKLLIFGETSAWEIYYTPLKTTKKALFVMEFPYTGDIESRQYYTNPIQNTITTK